MKLQQQDTTKLRHDMDNSLTLLTSQLQQKFDLLDKKLAEIERQNETIPDAAIMDQKYKQLEQKYLNLEQNFNSLKIENNVLLTDRNRMENEISLLGNVTKQEIAGLKNKSLLVDKDIENLKQLGSIKPLQEFQTLQQKVKSISTQTSALNMKDQARSQDFIALFSKVQEQEVTSNRSLTQLYTRMRTLQTNHNTSIKDLSTQVNILKSNHNTSITDFGTQINTLQTNYNASLTDLVEQLKTLTANHNTSITDLGIKLNIFQKDQSMVYADIESKIHNASKRDNQTFIQLQRQIDNSTEIVAMNAHPTYSKTMNGIIKFDSVTFSVGIDDIAAYKSTGKFTCEKGGLYLISVSIYSTSNNACYYVYLNGNEITNTRIAYDNTNPNMEHTGTVVVALQLRPNDSVWVTYPSNYYILGGLWSTLTIIKLK